MVRVRPFIFSPVLWFNDAEPNTVEPSVHSIDTALTAFLRTRKQG